MLLTSILSPLYIQVLSWFILMFLGGFLIFAITKFVNQTNKLSDLFNELRLVVIELKNQLSTQNNKLIHFNDNCVERHKSIDNHLSKHDNYIKELFKKTNEHSIDIKMMKRDIEERK